MTAAAILPKELGQMIEWRRTLHANPELSGGENHTHDFLLQQLQRLDIPVQTFDSHAGIVATLEGKGHGGVIALRADMDALPVTEETGVEYCSKNPGVMHACGHDGHMAMLLGAATALKENRNSWRGTVKLVFQPAEEAAPTAALPDDRRWVLENPKVDMMFGMHLWPDLPYGDIGICRDHDGFFRSFQFKTIWRRRPRGSATSGNRRHNDGFGRLNRTQPNHPSPNRSPGNSPSISVPSTAENATTLSPRSLAGRNRQSIERISPQGYSRADPPNGPRDL